MNELYTYKAKILEVIDGDTLDIVIDLGFEVSYKIRVRLLGVDTPEIHSKDLEIKKSGLISKKFVEDWVGRNPEVIVSTVKDKTEKYGRILATIRPLTGNDALNDLLIKEKLAVSYFGGKKKNEAN